MNNTINKKQAYITPAIEYVKIDCEISLQFNSDPPNPEIENTMGSQQNPFKANNDLFNA